MTTRDFVRYLTVAVIAVAVGATAMFFGLRWRAERAAAGPASSGHADHTASAPAPDLPPDADGPGVYISPARQQLIGVRTAAVSRRDVAGAIQATGSLAYDQTRLSQVHTKIAGWIDQVFVDFIGKPIRKGQALFTIYSPDLVATETEYLLARKAQGQLAASRFEETRQGALSLLTAARRRLELWDVTPAEIAEIERTGEPLKTLTVFAPASGVVLERAAFAGQYITPEVAAFKLVDLSTVWAIGQVVEADLPRLRVGQSVRVELSNAPGTRPLAGRVSFIYPDVDPATRRGRFRAEIPNPEAALKPDMFVTLTIDAGGSSGLAVPSEAVIDTGLKQYVILAREGGYFEPRTIESGAPAGGYTPIRRGLADGERVVVSAQFLIDSETNLQAAMTAMAEAPKAENPAPAAAPARPAVSIEVRPDPASMRVGDNPVEVTLTDPQGRPVADAVVTITLFMAAMPSMGMPAMRLPTSLAPAGGGRYRGTVQIPVGGQWNVTTEATRGAERLASRTRPVVIK